MTRWVIATFGAVLLLTLAVVAAGRLLGRPASRAPILVSVVATWLGAYVLWNFGGGLAVRYGWLETFDGGVYAVLALVLGAWQYRTAIRGNRELGLAVFVGGQLLWLVILLARNGALWH
jgi:hypothetical protein